MPAYCRICNEDEAYVSCNNCGSFACNDHHVWYDHSKNAFCTECFPQQAADAAEHTAVTADRLDIISSTENAPKELFSKAQAIMNDQYLLRIMGGDTNHILRRIAEINHRFAQLLAQTTTTHEPEPSPEEEKNHGQRAAVAY